MSGPGSGIDPYVKLLLHCNGADQATAFPDASDANHPGTAVGNAQVDTAQSKFGGASAALDGTGDYISVGDHADFDPGSDDFTIDMWAYLNEAMGTYRALFSNGGGAESWSAVDGYQYAFFIYSDQYLYLQVNDGGAADTIQSASTISVASGWHHFEVVKAGTTGYLFLDGTQVGTDSLPASITKPSGGTPYCEVGNNANDLSPWKGWVDEVRFSKGIARHAANFTPPTAEYFKGEIGWSPKANIPIEFLRPRPKVCSY